MGTIDANNNGAITSLETIPNTYYLVKDAKGARRMVFNNDSSNVVVRTALGYGQVLSGNSLTISVISNCKFTATQYDNGRLFIMDIAVGAPATVSQALPALGCEMFAAAIRKTGLTTFIDQLNGVTVYFISKGPLNLV